QLAAAISAAHNAGITHRDLKPENIMIRRDRILKVLDFGLAKHWNTPVGAARPTTPNDEPTVRIVNTEPGVVMGTVQYMSPEQARGQATDARSDIWSLGCVLYEMFSGEPPFRGETSADLIAEIVKTRPTSILKLNPDVPERLDEIITKSLEKDLQDRYQTSHDLLSDLKTLKRKFDLSEILEFSDPGVPTDPDLGNTTKPNLITTKSGPKDLTTVRGTEYLIWGVKAHRLMSFWIALFVIALLGGTALLVRKYWRSPNDARIEYAGKMRLAAQALEGSNLTQSQQLLDELKPEIGEDDLRGFEWSYLSRIVAERTSTQPLTLQQDKGVESIAFSPNGTMLATGGMDDMIHLWDATTGEKLKTLSGHSGVVWSLEFSPDGKRLLSGSADKTARIWDIDSGTVQSTLGGEAQPISNPTFSKDGKLIFASDSDSIKSWDADSAKESPRSVKTGETEVLFALSRNGKLFAYRSGVSSIKLIDSSSGRTTALLKGHGGIVTDIKFSADSKLVLTGSVDGTARLWNADTGDDIRTFNGHKDGIYDVTFSPDRKTIATSSHDKTIKIWNLEKGYLLHTLKGHIDAVQALTFSPDGHKVASGGADNLVKLWNVPMNEPRGVLRGHTKKVRAVSFSKDNKRLISTDEANESRLWSVLDESEEQVLRNAGSPAFSPDGKTLAAIEGKKLRFWDLVTGSIRQTVDLPQTGEIASYSPSGNVVATNHLFEDGIVRIWETSTGKEICSLTAPGGAWWISFSEDGKRVVTSSIDENSIWEWDTRTCGELSTFVGSANAAYITSYAPNGKIRALELINNLRSLKMIDIKDRSEIASFEGHDLELTDAKFSPNANRLATSSKDGTIKLWDPVTGQQLLTINPAAGEIVSIAFSPDGKTLAAAASDGTVRLFKSGPVM
ncbi:MAG: protein kinase domain-containing protein, partial [Pyrinomonadaceae bacterium]